MDLVEDHQAEAVAVFVRVDEGGVVGADGDALDAVKPSAQHTHGATEGALQVGGPLVHQVDGGGDDQGRSLGLRDGQLGHEALAAARG